MGKTTDVLLDVLRVLMLHADPRGAVFVGSDLGPGKRVLDALVQLELVERLDDEWAKVAVNDIALRDLVRARMLEEQAVPA